MTPQEVYLFVQGLTMMMIATRTENRWAERWVNELENENCINSDDADQIRAFLDSEKQAS